MKKIGKVLVMGGGSAGLLAALAIKHRNPRLKVRVVASKKRGTIGVGEGTVPFVLHFIHQYLQFPESEAYSALDPVYKLGVRLDWGKADYYDYSFNERLYRQEVKGLPKLSGHYVRGKAHGTEILSGLMDGNKALPSRGAGYPDVPPPGRAVAWHLENHRFVAWLEKACGERGIEMVDAEVVNVEFEDDGDVRGLKLESGAILKADLFVDSSGFASRLLGEGLDEPFESFADALFCDRAVVGGWDREEGEDILPYTVAQTMNCGWSWRIDHPERINRGYVFSSDHLSSDEAENAFREKNPKVGQVREISFRSGRRRRVWVRNVVGIGNAAGFVEPLEATAIMCACYQAKWLADGLMDSDRAPTETMRSLYNELTRAKWDEIRDFLALHYRFNDKLDSEFWKMCRRETPLGAAEGLVEFFRENGPSSLGSALIPRNSIFGLEGYYAHLIGLRVEGYRHHVPSSGEKRMWQGYLEQVAAAAKKGMSMEEVREYLMDADFWRRLRSR